MDNILALRVLIRFGGVLSSEKEIILVSGLGIKMEGLDGVLSDKENNIVSTKELIGLKTY